MTTKLKIKLQIVSINNSDIFFTLNPEINFDSYNEIGNFIDRLKKDIDKLKYKVHVIVFLD